MKKIILYSTLVFISVLCPQYSNARKFAVKVYDDINLGTAISMTSALPGLTHSSSANSFGVDFGYTFWHRGDHSLEANIGLGYTVASATFDMAGMSYSYAAPATADADGNSYQRHTALTGVEQKIDLGYLNVPLYLQYQYRATKWLGIHADLGFGFGFSCSGKINSTKGMADSYGVYPEYDQLVIKADYLNDFGKRNLSGAAQGAVDTEGFAASVMCGFGFEFYVADPVSFDLGIRYNGGLTNVFAPRYDVKAADAFTAETAPVTYTRADGQQVKALSDYTAESSMNPISLHIGVKIRF